MHANDKSKKVEWNTKNRASNYEDPERPRRWKARNLMKFLAREIKRIRATAVLTSHLFFCQPSRRGVVVGGCVALRLIDIKQTRHYPIFPIRRVGITRAHQPLAVIRLRATESLRSLPKYLPWSCLLIMTQSWDWLVADPGTVQYNVYWDSSSHGACVRGVQNTNWNFFLFFSPLFHLFFVKSMDILYIKAL